MDKIGTFLLAWVADLIWGDPVALPHPVVGFGRLIAWGEHRWNQGGGRRWKGALLAVGLVVGIYGITCGLLQSLELLSHWCALLVQGLLIFYCLAGTTLVREVREVFRAVDRSLDEGRRQVARIVGRDTTQL